METLRILAVAPKILIFLTCATFLAGTVVRAAGPLNWPADKTRVFVVGVLEWSDSESYAPFPKDDRRDGQLVEWFRQSGVPDANIVYLQDRQATLSAIRTALKKTLASSRPGEQLIVYYCGHGSENDSGDDTTLAPNDAGVGGVEEWSVNDMVRTVDAGFKGDRVAIFLDCCHAGGITRAIRRFGREKPYAGYGSSTSGASSTGNWTFTESLLRALKGEAAADVDKNGTITAGDLEKFIAAEMAFAEDQKSDAAFTGNWTRDTPLAVSRPAAHAKAGAHVSVTVDGQDWKARVLDVRPGEVQVFYYGYEAADTEWVTESQVKWTR